MRGKGEKENIILSLILKICWQVPNYLTIKVVLDAYFPSEKMKKEIFVIH